MKKATTDSNHPECRNCPALFPRRPHEKAYQSQGIDAEGGLARGDCAALSFAKDGDDSRIRRIRRNLQRGIAGRGLSYGELSLGLKVSYGIFFATGAKLPTGINVQRAVGGPTATTEDAENVISA